MIVHYANQRHTCDIDMPDTDAKTGLASFLCDGATLTSPYIKRDDEHECFVIVEREKV